MYPHCAGTEQSPVDLVKLHPHLVEIERPEAEGGKSLERDSGHGLQVLLFSDRVLRLDGKAYHLQQYHYHTPSENVEDGIHTCMEVHYVYQAADRAIVVLAVLIDEGENPPLEEMFADLPVGDKTVQHDATVSLIPESGKFRRFVGSLTTPPCTEGVNWLVAEEHAKAPKALIDKIKQTYGENNRPVQRKL
ncbi:MAG: uncharacterized protein KVP18_003266 [Porospora cf. gigantea A]|nr:MAG: hypothetical protein KVP18_003266 [Porospora cf. gigantea A]